MLPLPLCHRAQETALTGQIDGANAALANAQQAAKMKEQDLQQLEQRRDNLHQQVTRSTLLLHGIAAMHTIWCLWFAVSEMALCCVFGAH